MTKHHFMTSYIITGLKIYKDINNQILVFATIY